MAVNGYTDGVAVADITKFEADFLKFMRVSYPEIAKTIREKKALSAETEASLKKAIAEFNETFSGEHAANTAQ